MLLKTTETYTFTVNHPTHNRYSTPNWYTYVLLELKKLEVAGKIPPSAIIEEIDNSGTKTNYVSYIDDTITTGNVYVTVATYTDLNQILNGEHWS